MASTIYYNAIQQLYVQFLDRPADVPGMQYWESVVENAHGNMSAMAQAFAASSEYRASVAGSDSAHVVTAVYQNMFGHSPDLAGLNYWVDGLTRGAITIDGVVKAIVAGAQGSDLHAYVNKVSAATAYTAWMDSPEKILAYNGTTAVAAAKAFLAGVTDDASLSNALAVLAGTVPPPYTTVLPVLAHAANEHAAAAEPITLVGIAQAHGADVHML